jgi:hypothetical protein
MLEALPSAYWAVCGKRSVQQDYEQRWTEINVNENCQIFCNHVEAQKLLLTEFGGDVIGVEHLIVASRFILLSKFPIPATGVSYQR